MRKPLMSWTAAYCAALLALGLTAPSAARAATDDTPWLGVYTQTLDDALRSALGFTGDGVLVNRVVSDSPAAKAGLKENDVVTLDFVDGATKIGWNGEAKGSIRGEAFDQALTRIWLGDRPVQAASRFHTTNSLPISVSRPSTSRCTVPVPKCSRLVRPSSAISAGNSARNQ